MELKYSEWKPRKILEEIYEECRRKRTLSSIRPILAEKLNTRGTGKSDDLRKFTHSINGQKWIGFIYNKRNSLMGSTFGFYKNKFTVIRGYPKIKYVEDSRVLDKEVVAEFKLDGTNLGIWAFQDGSLMGKTRLVERWDTAGWHGRNWKEIFERTNLMDEIVKLTKDDYQVFGELYGKDNEGEFIKYSIPIAFEVLDIVDRKTFGFLDRDRKITLCNQYDIPLVKENWRGILTQKEAERLEFQSKELLKEDGYEGFVAKSYIPEDKDVYFCKLKCQEVREKCWGLSASFTIPSGIIEKAFQKATENMTSFKNKEEFEEFVRQELLEEVSEELVTKSKEKIRRVIERRMARQVDDTEVRKYLDELSKEFTFDITESKYKGTIMSRLADKFLGWKPATLYGIYVRYSNEKKKDNSLKNLAF
jgi:ATP-dependent RNA circularization protein (DNA/RNA ligase family)